MDFLTHSLLVNPSPWLVAVSSLLAFVIALVVISRDPHRAENRAFFALIFLAILANLNAAGVAFAEISPRVEELQLRLAFGLGGLSLFAVVLFARAFPLNRAPGRLLFFGLGGAALLHLAFSLSGHPHPLAGWYSRGYFVLCLVLMIRFVGQNHGQLRTAREKQGLLLVQAVILVRILVSVATFTAARAGKLPAYGLAVTDLVALPPVLAAVMGYALLRFQLFGLRFFLSRSLALLLVSMASLLVYLLVTLGVQLQIRRWLGIPMGATLATPVILVLLLVAFHPFRLWVEGVLDRRLDRRFTLARAAAEGFLERSQQLLGLRSLHRALRETVQQVVPGARVALLMARPAPRLLSLDGVARFMPLGWQGEVGTVTGEIFPGAEPLVDEMVPFPEGLAILEYFSRTGKDRLERLLPLPEAVSAWLAGRGLRDPLPDGLRRSAAPFLRRSRNVFPVEAPEALTRLQVDLALPIWRERRVDGVLLLQAEDVDEDRIRLLFSVLRHLGLQLENALLYQQTLEANEALTVANRDLEDTRLFLESLFENVPAGLAVVNPAGRVVRWNRALEALTGVPRAQALQGDEPTRLVPRLLERLPGAEPARAWEQRLTPAGGGEERITQVRLAGFSDQSGRPGGTVVILSDITEQVAMQQALEHSRRLAALGQFAAAMAHEIRTPMTSIQMNVQILASKLELTPEDGEYLEIVQTEIDRLNRRVSEILDFARPMRLDKAPLEMAELVEEVVRSLYFLLAERGVEVSLEVPQGLSVEADGERLKQVLINLLDNASHAVEEHASPAELDKTTDQDEPKVRIGGQSLEVDGIPGVEVWVEDLGCGIAPETLEHIFEPFYTTRARGTGLGLAISRKIVECHRGRLVAESQLARGSVFRLWLPVRG